MQGTLAPPHGNETVLLVEDEDILRAFTRQVLRSLGYTVLDAANATEALTVSAAHPDTIHLLATDVVMPGTGGQQLAEQMLALRPDLRVLYLSGYTSEAIVRHGVLQAEINFLRKPFTAGTLAQKIREVLDAPLPHAQ